MDCERFDKSTMDLLFGELDELSEAAALRHLHHCNRCRDIWGHLRTTRELSEIPLEEPPPDLFDAILAAEENAHKSFPARERMSRAISVLAGYAMRPQLAMAALLLLMIGSSLVFVRQDRSDGGQVSVTELGTPAAEPGGEATRAERTLVFDGDREGRRRMSAEEDEGEDAASLAQRKDSREGNTERSSDRHSYNEAMAAYQEGRYAEAERLFSEIASTGGERAASAALHEGHAARNGSGCQRAAALYDAVAERFQGGTVADEASWHAASCYRAMGQLKRASAHYGALKNRPAFAERATAALEEIDAQLLAAANTDSPAQPSAEATKPAGTPEPDAATEKSAGAPATPEQKAESAEKPDVSAPDDASNE